MKLNSLQKVYLIFLLALSMGACAPGGMQTSATKLADDPTSEPAAPAGNSAQDSTQNTTASLPATPAPTLTPPAGANGSGTSQTQILEKYSYVDPTKLVPAGPLKTALLYYDANLDKIKNPDYLSVIDFSQFSGNKRFYVINMKTGEVWNIRVAHGKGSDPDHDGYANKFSNVSGSNASSLGFYMTSTTYSGGHGYSLLLDGLSSTNSNVRSRAIVVHGADYVTEANVIQGRSWGCPAVAMENRTKLIDKIKNGSLIYATATNN